MSISMAGSGPSSPQMNVTPLIDVLLVLIIIFMVVVEMQKPTGEKALIPQPSDSQTNVIPAPERTVVIEVVWTANNPEPILKINSEDVSWADLQGRLHKIFDPRVERVAFIKGDDTIDFQYVAEVIDVAHHVGVERVGLLGKGQAGSIGN